MNLRRHRRDEREALLSMSTRGRYERPFNGQSGRNRVGVVQEIFGEGAELGMPTKIKETLVYVRPNHRALRISS